MSQASISDASLVAEDETKAQPTTSGSTPSSSHPICMPPPRFPKRLACIEVNSVNFEQGYDEQLVESGIPGHLMCSICRGLPRRPATLDGCGHLFCERCIKQHFMLRSAPQAPWLTLKAAPCPSCMQAFRIGEILTWPAWQRWAQLAFNAQVVRCPNGCAFSGTPAQTDDHQAHVCPMRVIACPVDRCKVRGPAGEIEHEHFPTCPLMRVHCLRCNLPVRANKLTTHDCIKHLKSALKSVFFPTDPAE